ncbi:MAG: TfoX/Sxy family protein [Pseudomonadota bacterium]
MAYDEGIAEVLRADLSGEPGIGEKKMFGGLCFTLHGNMLCTAGKGRGLFRVGKAAEAQALAIEGVTPMEMAGRRMGGFVDADSEIYGDDARRGPLLAMALDFVRGLPPK